MDKTKLIIGRIVLLAPLVLAFGWFLGLVANIANISTTSKLSPPKLNILITVLFIFILGYGTFLFFEMHRLKKSPKKTKVF